MSAALLHGNNYCGIDPNQKLFESLKLYLSFLRKKELVNKDIRCGLYNKGSEVFIKELAGVFDVSFTSPPYFNLEKYSDDECESTKNYGDYDAWIKNFIYPTVENTYEYLKIGGYAMINIKNLNKKYPLFDDFYNAFSSIKGFSFVENFSMKISSKKNYGMNGDYSIPDSEPIMSFQKTE
jgi:hypothetical protein